MDNSECTPHFMQVIAEPPSDLLPAKSAITYEKTYQNFNKWCQDNNVHTYNEDVLIAYFNKKAEQVKSPTLWSTYFMLKSTLLIKHNIQIKDYTKLIAFIKDKNATYEPKTSKIFTREEFLNFLASAPDDKYLMWKVCFIFGVAGACRMDELKKITIDNIDDRGNVLLVTIPDSKTGSRRTFAITDDMTDGVNPIEIYRRYRSLRPAHITHKSFFIYYKDFKCSTQHIGIHTFGKIPKQIAKYLKLSDAGLYTGHAFRRTSAALLSNNAVNEDTPQKVSKRLMEKKRINKQPSLELEDRIKASTVTSNVLEQAVPDKHNITTNTNKSQIPVNDKTESVCLKWNNHHSNMQMAFPSLLAREQYVDVTLTSEGQSIRCHKLVLCSCSSYFDEIISGLSPWQHPVIYLKGIPFWVVKALVDFMYIGEVSVEQSKLQCVLDAGQELKIKGLTAVLVPQELPTFTPATTDSPPNISYSLNDGRAIHDVQIHKSKNLINQSTKRPFPETELPDHLLYMHKGTRSRLLTKTPKTHHDEELNPDSSFNPLNPSQQQYPEYSIQPIQADSPNIVEIKHEPLEITETDVTFTEYQNDNCMLFDEADNDDDNDDDDDDYNQEDDSIQLKTCFNTKQYGGDANL